jgi:polysaccharide deacetylase 2 family uncharacterized protein YibQ
MDMNLIRRRLPEIAFAALFGAGLMVGGSAALAGLPKFLDAAAPGMAAQANSEGGLAHGVARLSVPQDYLRPASVSPQPGLASTQQPAQSGSPDDPPPRPVIAVCIDDLGEDIAGTDKAMALPKEVALSFLPYADTTPFLAQAASGQGHLVLAHVPMQALGRQNPGPMVLNSGMATDEIARRLGWNLAQVPGLVGINNHEGSRFTADGASLEPVMATLRARHLFFLDSRTGPDSQVELAARAAGVMTAGRDVFLDDDQSPAAVGAALETLAREARRTGVAIAIGHPHDVTLKMLSAWLAQDHGVTLVPLDEAIRLKNRRERALASR